MIDCLVKQAKEVDLINPWIDRKTKREAHVDAIIVRLRDDLVCHSECTEAGLDLALSVLGSQVYLKLADKPHPLYPSHVQSAWVEIQQFSKDPAETVVMLSLLAARCQDLADLARHKQLEERMHGIVRMVYESQGTQVA